MNGPFCLPFCLPHFSPLCANSRRLRYFASLHTTSLHLPFCLSHFLPLHFASSSFCLTSLHFTSLLFASTHLICRPILLTSLFLQNNSDIRKIQLWSIFEIIFTFAKDSDIRKIRTGESFEYLSHLQKIRTFKRFDSNFFPNLSNVLNILLTSLFLQKIQIFEKIRIGESFEYLSHLQKIRTFKRFDSNFFLNLSNVLNILLASLFLQKIQIFETFNSGELFHF